MAIQRGVRSASGRQGEAATGEPCGTRLSAGREARAAAETARCWAMLGEATERGVAFGSGVGRTGRGSGVESGIVSATVRVLRAIGEPVMVTTRYGAPPSPERTRPPPPTRLVSSSPQPVVTVKASAAVSPIQTARRRSPCCRINLCVPQAFIADAALMHQSERLPYRLQRQSHIREDNVWDIAHSRRSAPPERFSCLLTQCQ